MKKVSIISREIPNRPRSENYPASYGVTYGAGGNTTIINNEGGGMDLGTARKEFLSKKADDEARGVINFLRGLKINYKVIADLLRKDDAAEASDSSIMTALRVLGEIAKNNDALKKIFLSSVEDDVAEGKIRFRDGIETGEYVEGKSGGKIAADGAAELLTLLLRGALTIGAYREGISGAKITEQGAADLLSLLLREGLQSANFSTGVLGAGFCLKKDENGDSYLEVDRMLVRKVATFIELLIQRIRHVGGQIILTPASMTCAKVEDKGEYYRCYFDSTDGEKTIENEFRVGDQARAQTFNVKEGVNENVSNTYYWRLVVGVGDNYIDLSKTDCDAGSTVPSAGDDIVQLGNRDDVTRQAAIVLAAYGNDAPYIKMYRGINSYAMDGKEFVSFSRSEVMIIADRLKFSSGESVKDYIDNAVGTVNGKLDDVIADVAENISFVNQLEKDLEAVKNQVDGAIETWFLDPVPTLQNKPAVDWTTTELKNQHLGDLYYDANGKSYRFQLKDGVYSWQIITDSDITKALEEAKKAKDTADGKRRVFVRTPDNASVYDEGDLWVNATYGSTYNNDLLRCKTAKAANAQFSIAHWELASKYTDDTKANQAIEDAANAQAAADNAQNVADAAKNRLDQWAADGTISPTEKPALKDEIARIDADKTQIANGYTKYSLGTPSAYNSAHSAYRSVLVALTAPTPENIAIPSDFRAKQTTYYNERTKALTAISNAAKDYAQGIADDLGNYKKEVTSKFEQTNKSITAAVESSKTYTNNAIAGVKIRNYVKNTSKKVSFKGSGAVNQVIITDWYILKEAAKINRNSAVKVSFSGCKFSDKSRIYVQTQNQNGWQYITIIASGNVISENKEYILKNYVDDVKPNATGECVLVIRADYISGGTITVSELRCYEGGNDYGWTPAPEDSIVAIEKLTSEINVLEGEVNAKATKTEIDALGTRVTQAELNLKPDNIWLGISSKVDNTVSLNAGGTNLCIGSATKDFAINKLGNYGGTTTVTDDTSVLSKKIVTIKCTKAGTGFYFNLGTRISPGKRYTWSFYAKCSTSKSGTTGHEKGGQKTVSVNTSWQKITHSFTANNSTYDAFTFYWNWNVGETLYIHSFKFEEGSKATDWTPSPLDNYSTTEEIKTGITIKENAISIFGKDISLTGKITFNSFSSDAQGKVNTAQKTADAAKTTADQAKKDAATANNNASKYKEDLAKELGYASFTDMASQPTIIEGGKIRTSLIKTEALITKILDTTTTDGSGIQTRIDKTGISMKSTAYGELVKVYIEHQSGRNVLPTIKLSGPAALGAEFVQASNQKVFAKGTNYSASYQFDGVKLYKTVGTAQTQIKRPRLIWAARLTGGGSILSQYGSGSGFTFSVRRTDVGWYRVTHNLNTDSYFVALTAKQNGKLTITIIETLSSRYFDYSTTSFNGQIWSKTDAEVNVAIIYNPGFLADA